MGEDVVDIASQHKERELRTLLERGVVMMHLDPRIDGVVVPPQFSQESALRLNVAYAFNLPAFEISEGGIYAILSFNRQNFGCTIPWQAVYALTLPEENHEGMVWPDSMPLELKEEAASMEGQTAEPERRVASEQGSEPAFSLLPGGRTSDQSHADGADVPVTNSKSPRSHLTLIKS